MMAVVPGRGACPHLGLSDDDQTALAYPSEWNLCYRCQPPSPADLDHQSSHCLEPAHAACPVFVAPAGRPLPKGLRYKRGRRQRKGHRLVGILGLLALAGVMVVGAAWLSERAARQNADYQGTSAVQTAVFLHLQSTPFESDTPLASTDTVEPVATDTAVIPTESPESLRGLDQLIGNDYKFILHRIATGENIAQLAGRYNTTDDAIVAVNFILPVPIWVDWVVIIPVDRTDVRGLPAFETYLVSTDTPAETLAGQLGVEVAAFLFYNALAPGELLHAGDWVLVPRTPGDQ